MKSKNLLSIILLSFVLTSCSLKSLDGKLYKETISYTNETYAGEANYKYDKKGNLIETKWYDSNNELLNITKYQYDKNNNLFLERETNYDNEGNIDYIEEITYSKDYTDIVYNKYSSGKINYELSYKNVYYKNDNLKTYKFSIDGKERLYSEFIVEKNVENDILISRIEYENYYNEDGTFDYEESRKHTYNLLENQIIRKNYSYNLSNEEYMTLSNTETYDDKNNLTSKIVYIYDKNNNQYIAEQLIYEYQYNKDDTKDKETYFKFNTKTNQLELKYVLEFEYDLNKNLTTTKKSKYKIVEDTYVSKTVLDSISICRYEYDNEIIKTNTTNYNILMDIDIYNEILNSEVIYHYNSNDDEVYYSKKEYDENQVLTYSEERITVYNELNELVSYKTYQNNILRYEASYTYNSDNNLTNQTTKSYDEKGNITDFYIRDLYYYDLSKKK